MLLAGAMLLPANAFAASADDFSDFPSDWSAAGLRRAVDNGLLNGANGRIDGAGLLTRAQMAAIISSDLRKIPEAIRPLKRPPTSPATTM